MQNVFGLQQSALIVFGGLVAEINAPDVPAGSSPICCDMDFTVGSAKTRDGIESVYSFSGRSVGPENCISGTQQDLGDAPWTNPGNITIGDGSYATTVIATVVSPSASAGSASSSGMGNAWASPANAFSASLTTTINISSSGQILELGSLGFSLPEAATIQGVQVSFDASASPLGVGQSATLLVQPIFSGGSLGTPVGVFNSSLTPITVGGPTVLWNGNPTIADINALQVWLRVTNILSGVTVALNNVVVTVYYTTASISNVLLAEQFLFSLPALPVSGIEVGITGLQAGVVSGSSVLTVYLMKNGVTVGTAKNVNLTASNSMVVLGSPTDLWGTTWLNSDIDGIKFGVSIQAANSLPITVSIDLVSCTVFQSAGNFNFDWIKTVDLSEFGGDVLTLALDSEGTIWKEDVTTSEGMLTGIFSNIALNSFVSSVTEDGREFMAFSDLMNATDMPRQYDGVKLDRISQSGPGAPPAISTQSTTYALLASPLGVTQSAAVAIRRVFWSASPDTNSAAGNVLTVFVASTALIKIGSIVLLAGIPTMGGQNPNLTYIVNTIGSGQVNGSGAISPYFTVTSTISVLAQTNDFFAGGTYQLTLATANTTVPIPNVQVGSSITLSGVGLPAWDATWTVLQTPNAAQLVITDTSLTAGVATYTFTLVSGTLPVAGEQVTITQTSNGNGIFNVVNGTIQSATGTQFTVNINAPNVASAAEAGIGIINGTQFQFDPGTSFVGTGGNPILGNSGGGTLSAAGTLGAGTRQCVVIFQTENDYLTGPSIPVSFTTAGTTTTLTATQIPIGPPNVTKRILAFTGANGANFFYIPEAVTVTSNGQKITYSSTVISDNLTTTATFFFTDAVLLAATAIDIPGNNLFEQIELGDSVGVVSYSNRLFFWGEENKVQNFINMSFDGGYLPGTNLMPLGWNADAVNGSGGQLHISPIFGNSYYILNASGSTEALYGMVEQGAFQDFYQVPIIESGKKYGARVTCRSPGGVPGLGTLNIDLFSPGLNKTFGVYSLPLASMTTTMGRFSGNLMTVPIVGNVPADLLLRVYLVNVLNGGDCEIDRVEVYDLAQPVLSTQLRASYENNFEAFDDITGNLGAGSQNQQPVTNAFTMFDNLYIVKSNSFYSTTDNGTTEPFFWNVREVSPRVGTLSPNGVDSGEGWALIAGQAGLYLFEGGAPVKILPELDPLWKTVNWKYGQTLWIRNDTNERRIYIGVPVPTPNQWMPNFPVNANPTKPNVVLMCNYKELMTAAAIESEGPVRLTFMGDLRTFQLGRKWSSWSIQASYADFVERSDTRTPLFFCGNTNTGKIYEQVAGNYLDDGNALLDFYVTYPFPKVQEAQALGFGLNRLDAQFMTLLVTGAGGLNLTMYPDSLDSPYANALEPLVLQSAPPFGDYEVPLNETGGRFFIGLGSQNPGDHFEISKIVMALKTSAWAPVAGIGS